MPARAAGAMLERVAGRRARRHRPMTTTTAATHPTPLDAAGASGSTLDAVFAQLASGEQGLTQSEAVARLQTIGPNALTVQRVSALAVFVRQVRNPLLLLLLAAAAVSGLTGDPTDAAIIAAIVALSVGLGFVNEYRAANAVAALHRDIRHEALVWRDGQERSVDVAALVPGDVVALRVGDIVPADLRLIEATQLECDEAVLTGESLPVAKSPAVAKAGDSPLDLPACAFMGTVVHQGAGRGVVIATAKATAFGGIAAGLSERQADTAFQVGLRGFSRLLVKVAGALTVSIFVINVAFARPLIDALLFSLAIAIGITPQLLPAIVSVSLSSGSRTLARKRVLVKRLVTIEDLGNIEVLFTDKTGTLTEGAVTFHEALGTDGAASPEVFLFGLLCNETSMTARGPAGGNALDLAIVTAPVAAAVLADASGVPAYERLGLLPFDHERQLASVVVRSAAGTLLITKGAPETVLARCADVPEAARALLDRLFADGARVVAVATRPAPGLTLPSAADERDLRLEGFLTFVDRPKAGAGAAVAELAALGIAVKIITGDNGAVAAKVCRDIGIEVTGILTGTELEALDDDALAEAMPGISIFARVGPDQKSRLIKIARRTGADVAFMGDGVNDAVALHAADVGISVDSATEVAKDAADIVLLDKDLGVLADGVREGRRIFANTLKYVLMATSSNFGNMFSAAGASLFLSFLPMLPSQILLNNLLYDAGQMAIPSDRVDAEVVARPAAWDIAFVRRFMAVFGPVSSVFDFLTFFVMLVILNAGHSEFRSGWFVESLATQTLVVFVIRTRRVPFLRSRPSPAMIALPIACATIGAALPFTPLAHVLGFASLPLAFFLILLGMIAAYILLVELVKARFYAIQDRPRATPPSPEERHHRHVRRRARRFTTHVRDART
jgi:P-type Mg2+ transporter